MRSAILGWSLGWWRPAILLPLMAVAMTGTASADVEWERSWESHFRKQFEDTYQELIRQMHEEDKRYFDSKKATLEVGYPAKPQCAVSAADVAVTEFDEKSIRITVCTNPLYVTAHVLVVQALVAAERVRSTKPKTANEFAERVMTSFAKDYDVIERLGLYYSRMLQQEQTRQLLRTTGPSLCHPAYVAYQVTRPEAEIKDCNSAVLPAEVQTWLDALMSEPIFKSNDVSFDSIWGTSFQNVLLVIVAHELGHLAPTGANRRTARTSAERDQIELAADDFASKLLGEEFTASIMNPMFYTWGLHLNSQIRRGHAEARLVAGVKKMLCGTAPPKDSEDVQLRELIRKLMDAQMTNPAAFCR